MAKSSKRPLHLFLYHKSDDATLANYEQLCQLEGESNVQPISDRLSYLPNTFRADKGKWTFPHWDSYWMCDGLIYKYILNNKDRVSSCSTVCINEYDTWWQCTSDEWMPQLMSKCDAAASNVLVYGRDSWVFFDKHKSLSFASQLRGLIPFSVLCIKPDMAIQIASIVQNDERFHPLYNNEMRIGTAANILGAKLGNLPSWIGKNVQWHGCQYRNEKGIYHPVKTLVKHNSKKESAVTNSKFKRSIVSIKNKSYAKRGEENNKMPSTKSSSSQEFGIFTAAFYGAEDKCAAAANRLRRSVERFGCELVVLTGHGSNSLQEMKITRLIPFLENMDHKWLLWTDCGDTICLQDPKISLKYLKSAGKQILMSAEKNCWPEGHFSTLFPIPKENSKIMEGYRFLNSGVFVGLRKDIIRHLKLLEEIMNQEADLRAPWRTDQAIWTRLFVDQKKHGASIALDTSCNLSVSTYDMSLDSFEKGSRSGNTCIKVTGTGGKPIMMHFNGNDKHNADKIAKLATLGGAEACIHSEINNSFCSIDQFTHKSTNNESVNIFKRNVISVNNAVKSKFKRNIRSISK